MYYCGNLVRSEWIVRSPHWRYKAHSREGVGGETINVRTREDVKLLFAGRGDCHMIWMEADFNPHLSIRVSTLLGRRAKRSTSDCCTVINPTSYYYLEDDLEISKN